MTSNSAKPGCPFSSPPVFQAPWSRFLDDGSGSLAPPSHPLDGAGLSRTLLPAVSPKEAGAPWSPVQSLRGRHCESLPVQESPFRRRRWPHVLKPAASPLDGNSGARTWICGTETSNLIPSDVTGTCWRLTPPPSAIPTWPVTSGPALKTTRKWSYRHHMFSIPALYRSGCSWPKRQPGRGFHGELMELSVDLPRSAMVSPFPSWPRWAGL